jgi:chromosome segregation ATPase
MDAEFVEFLDQKFQKLEKNLRADIQSVRTDLSGQKAEIQSIKLDLAQLQKSLNILTNSVDRFVKLHEQVVAEQAALRSDIDRIKVVLKEKLGVQL